ncbi:transposase [Brachymonas denitrificans]|uniref:transposase n=1 Tax=Brachymonas denitrificans TaxID=28220 RepID=UPI002AFF9BB9|nr:transposase [Brachymonas denitrificans]
MEATCRQQHLGRGVHLNQPASSKPGAVQYSQFNKKIGAIRFKVEQAFGTMKRRFNLARARYFGTAKVQAQMCWAALGMNLLKAHRKLKAMELAGVGAP